MLVSIQQLIDPAVHDQVIALHTSLIRDPFPGFLETVPAYASLAIYYDPWQVRNDRPDVSVAAEWVRSVIEERLAVLNNVQEVRNKKCISIPVYYNGEDLPLIAAQKNRSVEEIIQIHQSRRYRVYMIGFLPGFPYMGQVDERIAVPRRSSPRIQVKAGSVAIAGMQTGIYPLDSPGGWQLIGQTPKRIFDAYRNPVCILDAGDEVQFISISKEEFEKQNEHPGT